jgi:hypothetical protein
MGKHGEIKITERDHQKGSVLLRWPHEGDHIKVKTDEGTKDAEWNRDIYVMKVPKHEKEPRERGHSGPGRY